jgi:hypothetical protein
MNFTLWTLVYVLVGYWIIILIYSVPIYSIATSGEVQEYNTPRIPFKLGSIPDTVAWLAWKQLETARNS